MIHQTDVENDIAKAIFDWLNRPEGEERDGDHRRAQPPYTFNSDRNELTVGVDGFLDCGLLARHIYFRIIGHLDNGAPHSTRI